MTLVRRRLAVILFWLVAFGFISPASKVFAQQFDPNLFTSLHWRNVGPFRGGRTRAIAGVPSQPNVFYIGVVNGGVWKTNDAGRVWTPVFDEQPTGSIGAIAVALSDPNIIYVGSGEGLHRPDLSVGDGIYKSSDAGKTWTHLGLRDGQQIPQIAVDPRDANRLLVAVAGHPYGPNPERGIFLSTDGGQNFQKVLYKDENIGGGDVLFDPSNSSIAYASLWEAREGPWENGSWNGPGGGIFKSNDGGQSWQQLSNGLPAAMVQAHLVIAPSEPQRLYAQVATKDAVKLYRSDDGGGSWRVASEDPRATFRIGGGDLPMLAVDPKNPDIIYVTSTVTWKSTDAGTTWTGFRGAPGGDDYQNIWINPNDPKIIALASDQGAIVSLNGGESWSSWYNQPTAQLYHANADNSFPYRVCSGQQESGSVCTSSRGNDGEITMREWHPVAAEEYGYVAPDPLDPDIIYGGKLTRFDRRTAQAQDILPKVFRSTNFRVLRTEPIVFSPHDPHILYFAANTLWKTKDGGKSWVQISPDLTRQSFAVPATVGKYSGETTAQPRQRGVIYAVAPFDDQRIWVGTDDGLIHLTTDGGAHWQNVSPASLAPFQKVSMLEASHSDAATAYAAINTLRLDDLRPHILRTRDSGKTWSEITNGIPNNENVNSVREDTQRKGLLFAGTEHAVYVSFDDGDHWQSLRLNMPATSVREVIVKNDDLVAATHGRGFWIMDDITPLRQAEAGNFAGEAFLFYPQNALRVRWNTNTDTPLPPDEPAGENPPDGAVIDYYLKSAASGPVTLEIRDSAGQTVRKYSSADPVEPADPMLEIPAYWVRPPQRLSTAPGMHRFVWDLHYAPVRGIKPEYPIAAVYHNTAPEPTSPWVLPGQYTVILTANGKSYPRPLTVSLDPRVRISRAELAQQLKTSQPIYEGLAATSAAMEQIKTARDQLKSLRQQSSQQSGAGNVRDAIDGLDQKIQMLQGADNPRPTPGVEPPPTFTILKGRLTDLFRVLQGVDAAPTAQALAATTEVQQMEAALMKTWKKIMSQDIPSLNQQLKKTNLPQIRVE